MFSSPELTGASTSLVVMLSKNTTRHDPRRPFRLALHIFGHSTLVNDEQIRFEIASQDFVVAGEGLVVEEVTDDVEDGTIQDAAALLEHLVAESLDEMAFSSTIVMLPSEGDMCDLAISELFQTA